MAKQRVETAPSFPYTRKDVKVLPIDERIEAIVADGMWYSLPKWRKLAKVSEEELAEWIDAHLGKGLVQSPTGAKSYRYDYDSVVKWHRDNDVEIGDQIFDFIFPARVWDNKTEVEGFLETPLREVGMVSFECSTEIANEIKEALKGIARVRESDPGKYKAYSLSSDYVKPIVEEIFEKYTVAEASRIYSRSSSKRRELIDFTPNFANHLVSFYKNFAKTLCRSEMETIKIYIPERADQNSQITSWVLTAIEKFDEHASVPFSGYLHSVLKRWPHDLSYNKLGKDLSVFQRKRSKAIKQLRDDTGLDGPFAPNEIAAVMGMKISDFMDLEEKHNVWIKTKSANGLIWDDGSEEKSGETVIGSIGGVETESDIGQANELSFHIIRAAIETDCYEDGFRIISQMGSDNLDFARIQDASEEFIYALGKQLGMT